MESLQHLDKPDIDTTTSRNGIGYESYFFLSLSYCQNIDPTEGNCVMNLTPKYLQELDDKYSKNFNVMAESSCPMVSLVWKMQIMDRSNGLCWFDEYLLCGNSNLFSEVVPCISYFSLP
jgi:hypothetical protein